MTLVLYLEPAGYLQYTFSAPSILIWYQYLSLPDMAVLLKLIALAPIPLFYSERKKYDDPSGGNDIAAQISRITDKITKLTQQLKEVANGSGSAEEKKKQQELIQVQIKVLQAQLAQLQRQQAEEAQKKQEQSLVNVEGPKNASDNHQIDIYV